MKLVSKFEFLVAVFVHDLINQLQNLVPVLRDQIK
ncbi:MAG: hypothetical protein ACI9DG_000799 [Oleispira sp.]|jgi:hypothetical protein